MDRDPLSQPWPHGGACPAPSRPIGVRGLKSQAVVLLRRRSPWLAFSWEPRDPQWLGSRSIATPKKQIIARWRLVPRYGRTCRPAGARLDSFGRRLDTADGRWDLDELLSLSAQRSIQSKSSPAELVLRVDHRRLRHMGLTRTRSKSYFFMHRLLLVLSPPNRSEAPHQYKATAA